MQPRGGPRGIGGRYVGGEGGGDRDEDGVGDLGLEDGGELGRGDELEIRVEGGEILAKQRVPASTSGIGR